MNRQTPEYTAHTASPTDASKQTERRCVRVTEYVLSCETVQPTIKTDNRRHQMDRRSQPHMGERTYRFRSTRGSLHLFVITPNCSSGHRSYTRCRRTDTPKHHTLLVHRTKNGLPRTLASGFWPMIWGRSCFMSGRAGGRTQPHKGEHTTQSSQNTEHNQHSVLSAQHTQLNSSAQGLQATGAPNKPKRYDTTLHTWNIVGVSTRAGRPYVEVQLRRTSTTS